MEKLVLNTSSGDYLIDPSTIVRLEASSNYSKLYFSDGKVLVTAKILSWFEDHLGACSFTRLHRSHLINNEFLLVNQCIDREAVLKDGIVIPVSKRRKKMVLQKLAAACLLFFISSMTMIAQSVGVGTATPHPSTVLDVQSNNKGLGIPSMSTAQRLAITGPKPGLMVFDLDKNTIYMHDGGQWLALLFSVSNNLIPPIIRTASDGDVNDQFGSSVSINGNYAVIGAPSDDVGANTSQGCAYVFYRNGSAWTEQAKLVASDGDSGENFGRSVSISGSYVIVGSPNAKTAGSSGGAAYVFVRSGTNWTEQAKLIATSPAIGDQFGSSVAIDGAYAVIGSRNDDIGANVNEGSAYFFHLIGTNWVLEDQVVAPFGVAQDQFGASVSISGDFAVIGAPFDDAGPEIDQGSAHVYQRIGTNWDYHAAFTDPFQDDNHHFGESVDIDGDYAVVGVPGSSSNAGSRAHVFFRTGATWDNQWTFHANPEVSTAPINQFGISVSIDGDYVIIGSNRALVGEGVEQGASYVYRRDGTSWLFVRRISDPVGEPDDFMGLAVGISGPNTITGSPNANAARGRILFFNLE